MQLAKLMTLILALFLPAVTYAGGIVSELSGTMSVKRGEDQSILTRGSVIKEGDVVTTEKGSYAQIKFSDGAVMTLKPGTQITINEHRFSEQEPDKDSSTFSLLKGGLRTFSGLIGKRGNKDAYKMNTATATIGIRGTVFDVDDCVSSTCQKGEKTDLEEGTSAAKKTEGGTAEAEVLVPAVYVGVRDGEVVVKNDGGELVLSAGQFGIAPSNNIRPLQLPGNPGLSQISGMGGDAAVHGSNFEIRNCR
jgi:hypothetical protein